jgi:hypothetical protein
MIMRTFAILVLVLLLCGASCTKEVPPPAECRAGEQVTLVPQVRWVEIDAERTAPVPDPYGPIAKDDTYGDVVEARQGYRELLQDCNAKLQAIDLIEGTERR